MSKTKICILSGIGILGGLLLAIILFPSVGLSFITSADRVAMRDVAYHDDNSLTFQNGGDFLANSMRITFTSAEIPALKEILAKADKIADECEGKFKNEYDIKLGIINGKEISYFLNPNNGSMKSTIQIIDNYNELIIYRYKIRFSDYLGKYKDIYLKQRVKELKIIKKVEDIVKPVTNI